MVERYMSDDLDDPNSLDSVIVDFEVASTPRTDFARDLVLQHDTLVAAGNAINLKIAAESRSIIHWVNPFLLSIKPDWNARLHGQPENKLHVLELAHSIAEKGVQEPLTVYAEDDHLWITNGHCRYLAVMHVINVLGVELRTIPIKFEDRYASEADRIATQLIRNSGKPLSPLEMARVCKQLHSLGWTPAKIGRLAGKTRGRIAQLLELHANTSSEIEVMINEGVVTPSFVSRVLSANGKAADTTAILRQAVTNANKAGKTRASEKHLPIPLKVMRGVGETPSAPNGPDVSVARTPDQPPETATPAGKISTAAKTATAARTEAPVPETKRKLAKDIFWGASITERDDVVTIEIKASAYHMLRELLGIPL